MKRGDPGYWEWRSKLGRPKKVKGPKHLWKLACEYFSRVDEDPVILLDFVRSGAMAGEKVKLPTATPYTWTGFNDYLFENGIVDDLDDYKNNTQELYTEYQDVIRAIDKVMYTQKFKYAATGVFKENIIARDLGLVDKKELKTPNLAPIRLVPPDAKD